MSTGRKGIAIPIFGMVLIVASIIFLFLLTQAVETKQRTIIIKGELAISGQNEVEISKRMAEANFADVVESVSGGICPTVGDDNIINKINLALPSGVINIDKFRTIAWSEPVLETKKLFDTIYVSGYQAIIFKDSRIWMTLNTNATYRYQCTEVI